MSIVKRKKKKSYHQNTASGRHTDILQTFRRRNLGHPEPVSDEVPNNVQLTELFDGAWKTSNGLVEDGTSVALRLRDELLMQDLRQRRKHLGDRLAAVFRCFDGRQLALITAKLLLVSSREFFLKNTAKKDAFQE